MADPIKQVIENGPRNYRALYTYTSADTDIASYVAADPTSTGDMGVAIAGNILFPGVHLKIWELRYNLSAGISLELVWDADTPQDAWILTGYGKQSFKDRGGLPVPGTPGTPITGATGKIIFNSIGFAPTTPLEVAGTISLEMWLKKDIAQ